MKLKLSLFVSIMLLIAVPDFVFSQDSTDPQQHLKIQRFAKMHGVHSDKLKTIMRNMIANLMKESEIEVDNIRRQKYLAKLAKRSKQVVAASKSMNQHNTADKLNEKETAKFNELAETLNNEAMNAEKLAKAGSVEELEIALGRFNQTCVDCHRLFREQ
jgi:cytochrome c556